MERKKIPRPRSSRTIKCDPAHPYFKPRGIPLKDIAGVVSITLEELEAIRLSDFEGKSQEETGKEMGISQSSVSRHLEQAHRKIAKALVLGLAIRIANPIDFFHCDKCGHTWKYDDPSKVKHCESCKSSDIHVHIHSDSSSQTPPKRS